MPVTRCVCHDISFADIKKLAEENHLTSLNELQLTGISSTKCKLCKPYLERMLQTGKTSFESKPVKR